jgi:hypothetical protein
VGRKPKMNFMRNLSKHEPLSYASFVIPTGAAFLSP